MGLPKENAKDLMKGFLPAKMYFLHQIKTVKAIKSPTVYIQHLHITTLKRNTTYEVRVVTLSNFYSEFDESDDYIRQFKLLQQLQHLHQHTNSTTSLTDWVNSHPTQDRFLETFFPAEYWRTKVTHKSKHASVTKCTTTEKTKASFGRLLWPPAWKQSSPINKEVS